MQTLRDAKCGDTVTVVKLHGEGAVKRRIMDMGITKGVEILIRKVAPLGDPVEVNVRGYELSLRKSDAEMIEVRSVSYTHLDVYKRQPLYNTNPVFFNLLWRRFPDLCQRPKLW